jgi:acetoin utilization deacetylase AcuC-like enzyme
MPKYRMVRDRLARTGRFTFACSAQAPAEVVSLAHDPQYVRSVITGAVAESLMRRIGFPWSEELVRRSLASVGGTLAASEDALARGWGGNLAGGTHHAFRSEGSGFCVFNDMAVAIHALRSRGLIRRPAVVDLDVHQGDGTAQIFADDPNVMTLSLHAEKNFPFRKQHSRIDVALPDQTGDEDYLGALEPALAEVMAFAPDIAFYQSGVDGHAADTLGRLSLTTEGLRARDFMVLSALRAKEIPCVVTLGGGYAQPLEITAEAHANTFEAAADIYASPHSTIALNSSLSVR